MRPLRSVLAATLLVSGAASVAAQSKIPANELPGRERERFIESPVERFMKPGPFVQPPLIEKPKPHPRKRGQKKRKPR